jgi:hypothetical protein
MCERHMLKLYADNLFDVTKELLHHVAHNDDGDAVEEMLDLRYYTKTLGFEVLIKCTTLHTVLSINSIERTVQFTTSKIPQDKLQIYTNY